MTDNPYESPERNEGQSERVDTARVLALIVLIPVILGILGGVIVLTYLDVIGIEFGAVAILALALAIGLGWLLRHS